MFAHKITDTEINNNRVASLPTRPTASASFGGKGYSAAEMKAAFDKLPLIIIEQFNNLLDDITRTDEEAITASIPTSIYVGHSLKKMLSEIPNGEFAGYLKVGDKTLANAIADIYDEIALIKSVLNL